MSARGLITTRESIISMAKRKSISKKIRFEIFKRDSFKCQYCGNSPPNIILELDHIIPVAKGGDNEQDNLVTSCFDCNRGKSDRSLDSVPESLQDKMAREKELESQLCEIRKHKQALRDRVKSDLDLIEQEFIDAGYTQGLTGEMRQSIKAHFLPKLDVIEICEAAEKGADKFDRLNKSFKYFCGICWNIIKDSENG